MIVFLQGANIINCIKNQDLSAVLIIAGEQYLLPFLANEGH